MPSLTPGHTDGIGFVGETDRCAQNLFSRAMCFQECGETEKAAQCYREAIDRSPHFTEAFYNLGVLHYQKQDWKAAIYFFGRAIDIDPMSVDAAYNLATALMQAGLFDQAANAYRKTIRMAPKLAKAYFHQGVCYQKMGDFRAAAESYRKVVSLRPDHPLTWFRLGEVVFHVGSLDDVLYCFQKTVELKPDWPAAHHNLSILLRKKGRMEEAIRHSRRSLALSPEFPEAREQLFRLAQRACDWQLMNEASMELDHQTEAELDKGLKTAESPLVSIRRHPDPCLNMRVAANWSRHVVDEVSGLSDRPIFHHRHVQDTGRLRIGYLSNDFRDHAVAYQIRGMLAAHDRSRFEIFAYACNPEDGTPYRRRMQQACDHFIDIHSCSDGDAARRIHGDGINILVDLMGYSQGNRISIAAMRPAPIQVAYLGFLGTTGAPFIDYVIADPIVIPKEHAVYYTEKIAYLPYCYQANDDHLPIAGKCYHRSDFNLPATGVVYCCFNQPYKIDAHLFAAWLDVLKKVHASVLWLAEQNSLARRNLCRAAEKANVNPARLVFADFMPHDCNLARLRLADLALDTCLYNGGATTSNALWAGVPVLTIKGGNWVSRMSASALNAVGLSELVARDHDEYRRLAIDFGRNPDKLGRLKARLAAHRLQTPLFNTRLFTRHMESAYAAMWHRFRNHRPPATFRVQP